MPRTDLDLLAAALMLPGAAVAAGIEAAGAPPAAVLAGFAAGSAGAAAWVVPRRRRGARR